MSYPLGVMILGAKGQLGRQITSRLAESEGWHPLPSDLPEVDVTQGGAMRTLIREARPAWVINCAAQTNVDRCESDPAADLVNAEAVGWLAESCQEIGSRFLQISTDYVFAGEASRPYREDDQTGPLSAYACSKLAAEQHARTCERHLIVRTAWLFGPGGRNLIATILDRAARGSQLRVVDDQVGSPSFAPDVAAGIERLMDIEAEGVFHLTNRGWASTHELACTALKLAGIDVAVTPISTADFASPASRPAYAVLDCSKYIAATGHQLRDWQAAVAEYVRTCFG